MKHSRAADFAPWLLVLIAIVGPLAVGSFASIAAYNWRNFDWRILDIATVLFGGTGLVSAVSEARRIVPYNQLTYKKKQAFSWLNTVSYSASCSLNVIQLRISQQKDGLSSGDAGEFHSMLSWFSAIHDATAAQTEDDLPNFLDASIFKTPTGINDRELTSMKSHLDKCISLYEGYRMEYMLTKNRLERTTAENIFAVLSPYFVALAMSAALLKAMYQPA